MSPRNLIVSRGERELHTLLQAIWAPYYVLPKVALRDVFDINDRARWTQAELDYMFHGAHFDFIIAESDRLFPLLAVEFDGFYHSSAAQSRRDRLKDQMCQKDGLRLLRYRRIGAGLNTFAKSELTIVRNFHEMAGLTNSNERILVEQAYLMMFLVRCLYESFLWDRVADFEITISDDGRLFAGYKNQADGTSAATPIVGMLPAQYQRETQRLRKKLTETIGAEWKVGGIELEFGTSKSQLGPDPDVNASGEPAWPPSHFGNLYVPHQMGINIVIQGEVVQTETYYINPSVAIGICAPNHHRAGYVSVFLRYDLYRIGGPSFPVISTIGGKGPVEYYSPVQLETVQDSDIPKIFKQARNQLETLIGVTQQAAQDILSMTGHHKAG